MVLHFDRAENHLPPSSSIRTLLFKKIAPLPKFVASWGNVDRGLFSRISICRLHRGMRSIFLFLLFHTWVTSRLSHNPEKNYEFRKQEFYSRLQKGGIRNASSALLLFLVGGDGGLFVLLRRQNFISQKQTHSSPRPRWMYGGVEEITSPRGTSCQAQLLITASLHLCSLAMQKVPNSVYLICRSSEMELFSSGGTPDFLPGLLSG